MPDVFPQRLRPKSVETGNSKITGRAGLFSMLRRFAFLVFCSTCVLPLAPVRPVFAQPLPDRVPLLGEVRDQDGNLLPGVVISIRRQDDTGAYAFWGSEAAADDKGRFRFPDAEEGRYYMNAEKGGYASLLNQSITWPGGQDVLRVRMEKLSKLKFRVIQPDGTPLKNSNLQLRMRGDANTGQNFRRVSTDGDGLAVVESVNPGRYSIFFVAQGVGNFLLNNLEVRYTADPAITEIKLQQGGSLHVRAVEKLADGAPGKPLGGAQIILLPSAGSDPGAQPVDPNENMGLLTSQNDRSALSTRDGDGTVTMTDLPPGQYSARLFLPGWTQQPPKNIEITAGKTTELEWAFALRPSASLKLTVNSADGKPVANQEVTVRIMPLQPNMPVEVPDGFENFAGGNGARRGITDGEGKVVLYPLRAGKYRLWVVARGSTPTPDRRGAVSLEAEATLDGGAAMVTLPVPPGKP